MESRQGDMCRVCRSEGSPDKPLYHPCVCTGSIKYIHQDCLVQWLKYSKKEYCELCKHRYIFTPIYAPDMPKRLPIRDLVMGLLRGILRAVRYWLHYTLVALAWLGIVPLTACRIYRCLFSGSFGSVLTLPLDLLSTDNIISDCFQGCFIVTCTLCTFISLVWLREQILHGGGPDWLEHDPVPANQHHAAAAAAGAGNVHAGGDAGVNNAAAGAGNDQDAAAADGDDDDEGDDDHDEEDNENNGAVQDEANWNPMDWDRAAEELTWERLLGLDGSLLFMEHVFWVVSLNTLFILVFAFCPYHIGQVAITGFHLQEMLATTHFDGVLTTILGYVLIAISLAVLHSIATFMHFKKFRRVLGLCYVAVKVSLLVVGEIGFFPLICGWWLDICSLNMFEASLKDRENSFRVAPGTSMFIHWLVGMVYIFYFASFILLLREVLRPGVLWFLRNLNDPDFNPIQEMIHLPVFRHARRFLASMVVFGTIVLVMLWLPVQCVRRLFPNFLPFHVMLSSSDTPVSELSLELLLLQVVLPALLEQGHTRQWLKALVRLWCVVAAWLLDLRSYLLGDVPLDEPSATQTADEDGGATDAGEQGATAENDEEVAERGVEAEGLATVPVAIGLATAPGADGLVVAEDVTDAQGVPVAHGAEPDVPAVNSCLQVSDTSALTSQSLRLITCSSVHDDSTTMGLSGVNGGLSSIANFPGVGVTVSVAGGISAVDAEAYVDGSSEGLNSIHDFHNHLADGLLPAAAVGPSRGRFCRDHRADSALIVTPLTNGSSGQEPDAEDSDVVTYFCRHITEEPNNSCVGYEPSLCKNHKDGVNSSYKDDDAVVNFGGYFDSKERVEFLHEGSSSVDVPTTSAPVEGMLPPQQPPPTREIAAPPAEEIALPPVAEEQMANGQLQEPVVANAVIVPPPADDILPPLPIIAPIVPQGLGDVHQAMMQGGAPVGFQPYKHPNLFALRLLCLVALLCFTLFLASLASLLIPVYIGRRLMGIWTGEAKIHELYTVACGLYACWVALRMAMILYTWIPQGWRVIFDKVVEWTVLVSKSVFIAVMLIGIVPLMLGLIFELVIVMPIRVPLEMTPIFFPWQDWALGVLHAKIITAATMMGPQWRLKRVIEQVYQQGLRNVNLKYVMVELCLPVVVCLGLILAVPHIIAKSIVPAFGCDFETQNLVLRRIYPFILGVVLFVAFCIFQARQFRRLYEHIKNDKYLVGQRLVNYDRHQS